jgi:hypothetical protein
MSDSHAFAAPQAKRLLASATDRPRRVRFDDTLDTARGVDACQDCIAAILRDTPDLCVSRTDCGSLAAYVFDRYTTCQGRAETSGCQGRDA